MSADRTLPIPKEHRQFTVKAGGQEVPRTQQLISATVIKSANHISWARLVYLDGAASASDFPLSNTDTFAPGKEIEVLAGSADNPVSLFEGVVVRQSLKVRNHVSPQFIIECRHKAVKLTVGRKSAYFLDQTDSDIITALLSHAGLKPDVEATSISHKQQVQYACTDWDFLLMRAEANGKLVFTNDQKVKVGKPVASGSPVFTLHFGSTLLELDTEIDARSQFKGVQGISWDPGQQQLIKKDASDPGIAGPGNVPPNDLAEVVGLDHYDLCHAAVGADEAQAWADAQWLKSRLSKVKGRAKCEGIATVNPGDILKLEGIGDRCNGQVLVLGVRHDMDLVQGWKTHVHWGDSAQWAADAYPVSAPAAGGLLAAANGLHIGVVVSNEDPEGEFRIRVRMPLISEHEEGTWARVALLDGGKDRGFCFRPELGDEVVLGFLQNDPRHPVILGMLHSSAKAAPLKGSNPNHEKLYQSRSKLRMYFNDEKKILQWQTPAGNSLTLSEEDKAIEIKDQNGNQFKMSPEGITLQSSKAVTIKSGTDFSMESGTALSAKGGTSLKLTGTASAELSSAAATAVKGAVVQLN